jgi:hypothetical protein
MICGGFNASHPLATVGTKIDREEASAYFSYLCVSNRAQCDEQCVCICMCYVGEYVSVKDLDHYSGTISDEPS